jgi:hypothetical protein
MRKREVASREEIWSHLVFTLNPYKLPTRPEFYSFLGRTPLLKKVGKSTVKHTTYRYVLEIY